MLILALDTATLVSSVALVDDKKVLAELTLQTQLTHSEVLMPHIQQVLAMAKVDKKNLAAIAVSIGPGSFTGLRIGLATAKSMAYALKVKLLGVSTLEALAYHYPVEGVYIAPLLDAQKGNAYVALYEWRGGVLREVGAPCVESFAAILDKAAKLDQKVVLLGDTVVKHWDEIKAAGGNIIAPQLHTVMPRAACVALAGQTLLRNGRADDLMSLEPVYIRRSEAEELWEARNGKTNG